MSVNNVSLAVVILFLFFTACTNSNEHKSEVAAADTLSSNMKSYIAIFEIPANEIERSIKFYETILGVKIEMIEMPEMKMGIFPFEGQMVTGVIVEAKGYKPSRDGVTIYLNGGDNLQLVLDRVENNGGKIITQKTPHADGNGFFAIFLDSEGNKMGLNSPN